MHFALLLIANIFISVGFAANIGVDYNDATKQFVQQIKTSKDFKVGPIMDPYSLGLQTKSTGLSRKLQSTDDDVATQKLWEEPLVPSFEVSDLYYDKEIRNHFKSFLNKTRMIEESFEDKGKVWKIQSNRDDCLASRKADWSKSNFLTEVELTRTVMEYVQNYLPQFKDQIELANTELEFESIDNSTRIVSFHARFSRIFKGGVVLRNISYIKVTLDGRGELQQIEIKWPKFSRVASNELKQRTGNEITLCVEKFCQNGEYIKPWGKTTKKSPASFTVNSAARGWLPIYENGKVKIVPAASFSVSSKLDNGEMVERFVDVPFNTGKPIDDESSLYISQKIANGSPLNQEIVNSFLDR